MASAVWEKMKKAKPSARAEMKRRAMLAAAPSQ